MKVISVEGENIDSLWSGVITAITTKGPVAGTFFFFTNLSDHEGPHLTIPLFRYAVVSKRKMAAGIPGLEGTPHAHDAISVKPGMTYLKERGYGKEVWGLLEVSTFSRSLVYPQCELYLILFFAIETIRLSNPPRILSCTPALARSVEPAVSNSARLFQTF